MPASPPSSVPAVTIDDDQHHDHDVLVDSIADSPAASSTVATSSVVLFDLPPSLPRPLPTATTATNDDDPVDVNHNHDDDTERRVVDHDEVSSYTSATSATTVSSHEGELAQPPTRPRSASLHILSATPPPTGTLRAGSRERARTRTPLRGESPLLILRRNGGDDDGDLVYGRGRRALSFSNGGGDGRSGDEVVAAAPVATPIAAAAAAGNEDVHVDDNPTPVDRQTLPPATTPTTPSSSRSRQAERRNRHHLAIPEVPHEDEEQEEQQPQEQQEEQSRRRRNPTTSTRAGHWLSRAAAAPAPSSRRRPRSSHPTRSRLPALSAKQRPSHRKLRRWNNDRFVDLDLATTATATALEELYHDRDRDDDPSARHLYWKEHYMPNYPLRYRSAFAALARDETAIGTTARDRFVKGEVGKPRGSIGGDGPAGWRRLAGRMAEESKGNHHDEESERDRLLASYVEREIVAKLRKMGVADAPALLQNDPSSRWGKELFRSLAPRVRAVLSRSCHPAPSATPPSSPLSAERIVHALESYLASLAHGISHVHHVPDPSVFHVLRRILAGPPRIVLKNRYPLPQLDCGAVVPTVHFHFAMTDDQDGAASSHKSQPQSHRRQKPKGTSRSGAFHRILLHAVCRFHGLETSSTVRADRDETHVVVKVVTVQGGIMLAPSLRLLDFVEES